MAVARQIKESHERKVSLLDGVKALEFFKIGRSCHRDIKVV